MDSKKLVVLISLLILSTVFAQDGIVIQSDKLTYEWEYYKFDFSNGLTIYLPVLKDRTDFLAQKLEIDRDSETGKFLFRYTYRIKNQLYLFLIATRGVVPGLEEKSGDDLKEIIKEKITEVSTALVADGFASLGGHESTLTNVTSGMSEVISVPRYFTNNSEFIFYHCDGYKRKTLKKGENNEASEDEIKNNVEYIIKNLTWKSD